MRRTIERIRSKMAKRQQLLVAGVSVFGLVLCLATMMTQLDIVTVTDAGDGTSQTLLTTSNQKPEAILALVGVKTDNNDEIVYTTTPQEGANIVVNRSFPVNVLVDGSTLSGEATEGTVADFLQSKNVELGEDDIVQPALDAELTRGMTIEVGRVTYAENSRRVEVNADDVAAFVATLPEDEAASFVTSKSRIYDMVYQDTLVNGEVTESEMVAMNAVYHPYDAPSGGFEPGVPVSTIDAFEGVEIGEDGIPTHYTRKIEGAVATAYSASAGRGAGGQGLYCGTVAVNPNVIPYGTRLYITSANGKFVYGYAIASDCGTAMMEGYVDVDLYFETNAECRSFGKRALDVYILD
ncbi:ubiquitin-like domain-containing protein [Ruminococcaceae bacterium OttesenSCG-928-A16]|nr:ubiquitin-like domain-containing protein [Ruminococcaceae bacterium OttesenSCG-928-A16]